MKVGSLFAGIGGFDLGFERAGIELDWQVEIDHKCQETLTTHFPNTERLSDVREVGRHNLRPVDVICGGFPCQDLSVAGRRKGLAGERSGLYFQFHRILKECRPRWFVIENVPGLLSNDKGRDFAVILRGLAELGYGVCWRVLDAQFYGVAQRRRRVFIAGSLGDYRCLEILFESESVSWDSPACRKAGESVAYTVRANPSHSGDKGDGGLNTTLVASPITVNYAKGSGVNDGPKGSPQNLICFAQNQRQEIRELNRAGTLSSIRRGDAKNETLLAHTLRSRESTPGIPLPGRGGEDDFNIVVSALDSQQGGADDNSAQANHLVSVTLTVQGSQSCDPEMEPIISDGYGIRRLTPLECERLQGFPDNWTAMHKDTVRYAQIGNAVAVPVADWIANRILRSKHGK